MEKINIAELLKYCPKGMELDCTMYDNCTFDGIEDVGYIEILVKTPNGRIRLTKEGCYVHQDDYAKCVIFPKGKTTWEGFVPPCIFKDGDIVATENGAWIGITTGGKSDTFIPTYCVIKSNNKFEAYLDGKQKWGFTRLATEKEKQKLFNVIRENGYKWNNETKTLEKLIVPKFKVGDRIKKKGVDNCYAIEIAEVLQHVYTFKHGKWQSIEYVDKAYELVSDEIKPKFKVGDNITDGEDSFTISYIDNRCYYNIKGDTISRLFIEYQDNWKLIPSNKFDISTLVPFETKVLVRDHETQIWKPAIFGLYIDDCRETYKYFVVGGTFYKYLIPYEGNEHLRGKTDDCIEYYKVW